jgi:hypothetical protein
MQSKRLVNESCYIWKSTKPSLLVLMAADQKRRVRRVGLCLSCTCVSFALATAVIVGRYPYNIDKVGVLGILNSVQPKGCAIPLNEIVQVENYHVVVDSWRKFIKIYKEGRNDTLLATMKSRAWTVPYVVCQYFVSHS